MAMKVLSTLKIILIKHSLTRGNQVKPVLFYHYSLEKYLFTIKALPTWIIVDHTKGKRDTKSEISAFMGEKTPLELNGT